MEEFQLFAFLVALIVLFCGLYFTRNKLTSRGNIKLAPSPPTLPVIGNLHQLGHLPHRSLWELSTKYGPIMLLKFGSKPTLVISSAAIAKEILKTHDLAFANKPVMSAPKKIFYDLKDLVNLQYGEQWRKIRSIFVHELLNSTRVKSFNTIREEEIGLMVEKIKRVSSSPVNLTYMFTRLTNDMICRSAFGKKHSETGHGKIFLDKMDDAVALLFNFTIGEFVPWLGWINRLNGFNASLDKYARELDEVLNAVIEDHMSRGTSSNGDEDDGKSKENFVDILLGIYKGNTPGVSIDLISLKAVILDALGAGTETSTTTLIWVMTELIRNPPVMTKLQDEIREIMEGGKQQITDEDLQKMQYLKAVIKETFRCHPPVAIYFRAAREYVNLMGYDIAPETMILINAWAIGRDPSCWDEPEKFMPERFLNSCVDFRGFDFQLIPFGAGRRICPGLGFAAISIEHTVANLMQKFDWALPHGAKGEDLDATERPGFTIGKKEPLIVVPTKSYF
ncbi:hypothetical protein DH2020_048257 [Rehmannia glutinosa]|uniref:Cytochrome P450 n=1 Tax=Rehmannia glutinosa TaxID=99300 RepID=A0ABR0U6Y3_REHGL